TMSSSPVADVLAEVTRLQDQMHEALENRATTEVERLMTLLAGAERRRNRLVHSQLLEEEGPNYVAEPPQREQVIRTLSLLARPELDVIERDDRAERDESVIRARQQLDEFDQLFGSPRLRGLDNTEA